MVLVLVWDLYRRLNQPTPMDAIRLEYKILSVAGETVVFVVLDPRRCLGGAHHPHP